MVLSTNHITVEESSSSNSSDGEVNEVPHELEDGTQSTVDELKEIGVGISDDPRPIQLMHFCLQSSKRNISSY